MNYTEKIVNIFDELVSLQHNMEDNGYPKRITRSIDSIVWRVENLMYNIYISERKRKE